MIARGALMALTFVVTTSGCGTSDRWEITAENKSDSPCSIVIEMGKYGDRTARVDNFFSRTPEVLIAEPGPMLIRSITVKRGNDVQIIKPQVEMAAGRRMAIVVGTYGEVAAPISQK
jgi:hypothetical protein